MTKSRRLPRRMRRRNGLAGPRRGVALLGILSIALGAVLATTVAPSNAAPASWPQSFNQEPSHPDQTWATKSTLTVQCPNGIAATPGSDPAEKELNSDLNDADSFKPGGTVHYVYNDNPTNSSYNFELQDCVVVYPADTFDEGSFDPDTGLYTGPPFTKSDITKTGTQIDGASLSGIAITTGEIFYSWTAPSTLAPGQWVCNFARDISTGHGGGGNRKVSPVCYQVPKRDTSITTQATASIRAGQTAQDQATLTAHASATGTITFDLYGNNTCTGTPAFSSSVAVEGGGTYTSAAHTLSTAGTYYWKATYSGDSANESATHACAVTSEITTVSADPVLALGVVKVNDANGNETYTDSESAAGAGADVPFKVTITNNSAVDILITSITDQWSGHAASAVDCDPPITLTLAPTASVDCTFTHTAYSPAAGTSLTNTVIVNGHEVGFTSNTAQGSDTSVVSTPRNSPTLTTVATASAAAGSDISDTATLSGATEGATGTIDFNLYTDNECGGVPVFHYAVPVDGNGSYGSGAFTTPANVATTYYWVATYSGDSANNPATHDCGIVSEQSTVTTSSTSTTQPRGGGGGGDPTTTTAPSTTTTAPSTTTAPPILPFIPDDVLAEIEVAPTTTTAPEAARSTPVLPFTGSSSGSMSLIGIALITMGGFLVIGSRGRKPARN